MTIKDILVHVDGSESSRRNINYALKIAEKYNSHITGIHVYRTPLFYTYSEISLPAYVYADLESQSVEKAEQINSEFVKWAQSWKDRTSFIIQEGDTATVMASFSAHHDMVICSQEIPGEKNTDTPSTLNRCIIESAAPVLVTPSHDHQGNLGKRILIAWNGKKESARAVRDALPFLQNAEEVEVVTVNKVKGIDLPCIDIAEHLARHDVNINSANTETKSRNTGEAILYLAQSFGADMIVMGAYGHSRLREYILGGATRHILETSKLPVLLSH